MNSTANHIHLKRVVSQLPTKSHCHGSMIHEVLFQAGNHSVSCGILGKNGGFPLHHFSGGFPHCLE